MQPADDWVGTVERLAWGGLGVARAEDGRLVLLAADGPIFPGEQVRASLRWKVRHAEGRIIEWLSRDTRFNHERHDSFSAAGYELYAAGDSASELKQMMAADLLRRNLPGHERWQWLAAPPDALRHRIQLHWDGTQLGYHRRGTNQVVEAENYPVAVDAIENAMRLMSVAMKMSFPRDEARWEIATGTPPGDLLVWRSGRPQSAWLIESGTMSMSHRPLVHRLDSWMLQQSAGSFFQACPPWAWTAFSSLFTGWGLKGSTLYDLYGGVGFFSAMLASRFSRFVLVEGSAVATSDAKSNLAGLDVDIHAEDVDLWLRDGLGSGSDCIILDPPRTGLTPGIGNALLRAGVSSLVLVGCDGAAFCRDARKLSEGYKLKNLAAIDLFPYSLQAEFVGMFVRDKH